MIPPLSKPPVTKTSTTSAQATDTVSTQATDTASTQPKKTRKTPTSLSKPPEPQILFDESHDELLRSEEISDDDEIDTWGKLSAVLKDIGYEAIPYRQDGTVEADLAKIDLSSYKVLVLAAPRKSLSDDEVEAIANFVYDGGSLLIAQNYQSLNDNTRSLNLLLEKFGLRTKPLLTSPPQEIHASKFRPHYLSSEIDLLLVEEPAYLEKLNDQPHVVANLPKTEEHFLVAVTVQLGRVVAIGDVVIFADKYIDKGSNKNLALNIFQWLTHRNSLDCFDAQFEAKVRYGKNSNFSISLSNPHQKRLEHISCLLESDAGAVIDQPEQRIRSLPSGGRTQLRWLVEPQKLGSQSLRLTIDFPETTNYPPLFFDFAAQFQCIPDVEIDLVNLSDQHQAPEIVETGVPFEMQAMVRWKSDAKQVPLQLKLKGPGEHVLVEPIGETEANRWRLTAFDEGDWKIRLEIADLNQPITRLIRVYPSTRKQINDIETEVVIPLAADVHHKLSQLRKELVLPVIKNIPFRLLTLEDQVRLLESPDDREDILEALRASRKEENRNQPLVQFLLENIAPTYSVVHGCCIPYDPKLAEHLVDVVSQHPIYEEHLAYNFMSIDGDNRYGQTWLQQNIAALLLHEKHGHGFFFTQTKVGKQLAILYRHGLAPGKDSEQLRSPYPRLLYTEYKSVIELIYDSTIIVNEGFATWLELTMLPRISELIGQAAYRRRDFLFSRDTSMVELAQHNEYFQKFQPQRVSKYREGCEYLELIQGYFGADFGPKCAVQAMIKATDIDLGISESDGQVRFTLGKEQIKEALLENESNDARSDERLRAIHDVLREHKQEIWEKQEKLQCHRICLHCECPINGIISATLSW